MYYMLAQFSLFSLLANLREVEDEGSPPFSLVKECCHNALSLSLLSE